MSVFVQSVEIAAPVETVFQFHEREDALPLLMPAFPPVQLIAKTPGIGIGTRVELRIVLVHWVALHTTYEQNKLFVDEQVKGPFARWVHRHEFENIGERTRLTDRVEYSLRGGPVLNALLGWTVRIMLGQMFAHRHATTKRLCETAEG
jgi:ligand-binding SRPBCC domain-containing protein